MGRPRKWKNDAERMAANRAQAKLASGEDGTPTEVPPVRTDTDTTAPVQEIVQIEALEQALKAHNAYEELGRHYGVDTATRLGEDADKGEARVKRAIAYQRFLQAEGKPPT